MSFTFYSLCRCGTSLFSSSRSGSTKPFRASAIFAVISQCCGQSQAAIARGFSSSNCFGTTNRDSRGSVSRITKERLKPLQILTVQCTWKLIPWRRLTACWFIEATRFSQATLLSRDFKVFFVWSYLTALNFYILGTTTFGTCTEMYRTYC